MTAKLTAKGTWREKPIIMEIRRYGGGLDENDDWQTGTLEIVKDGKKFTLRDAWRASRHDDRKRRRFILCRQICKMRSRAL